MCSLEDSRCNTCTSLNFKNINIYTYLLNKGLSYRIARAYSSVNIR
jgi:hypothetical protein